MADMGTPAVGSRDTTEVLRQPDVKGSEMLRGAAPVIMLIAPASCVSCLRQGTVCTQYHHHGHHISNDDDHRPEVT